MERTVRQPLTQTQISRRNLFRGAIGAGALLGLSSQLVGCAGTNAANTLSVLTPAAPDPAPVGVAEFGEDAQAAFDAWKSERDLAVDYQALPWPQLHDRLSAWFASGNGASDVAYMCGWIPEFSEHLADLGPYLSDELIADMPESSFSTTTWDGKVQGAVFTLSLLTMFYNEEHLDEAGLSGPPTTWDELKGYAKELTREGRYGWVLNYGDPAGIGGVASYWMTFLQQAGGSMYGDDGQPVFNDAPGVDALQFMIDLQEAGGDPASLTYVGINDASNVFQSGQASMMFNWPYMWVPAQDPEQSQVAGKIGSAILPAGEAGSASIDGTDAWSIANTAEDPEMAAELIEFYLSPEQQKAQVLETGWLPIRLSVLNDPEVQEQASNAKVVLEQAEHPYDSFLTPDYTEISQALGTEFQRALQGEKSASDALRDGEESVKSIIAKRA